MTYYLDFGGLAYFLQKLRDTFTTSEWVNINADFDRFVNTKDVITDFTQTDEEISVVFNSYDKRFIAFVHTGEGFYSSRWNKCESYGDLDATGVIPNKKMIYRCYEDNNLYVWDGASLTAVTASSDDKFLRKDINDTARGIITFTVGTKWGSFSSDSGAAMSIDKKGRSYLELDRLKVRLKAYFETLEIQQVTYVGGKLVVTPGRGFVAQIVEETETAYRCYYLAEQDGKEVKQTIVQDDFLMYKEFNIGSGVSDHVENRYYWRHVDAVSTEPISIDGKKYHWVDVSKSDCDEHSCAPEVGDNLCQVGNRTQIDRQGAIVISTVDLNSPSITMYSDINDYTFANKDFVEFGIFSGRPYTNIYGSAYIGDRKVDGKTPKGYIEWDNDAKILRIKGSITLNSTFGDDSDRTIESVFKAIESSMADSFKYLEGYINDNIEFIQSQVDKAITTWFYDDLPYPHISSNPDDQSKTSEPATGWNTDEDKALHEGDLYYAKAHDRAFAWRNKAEYGYIWEEIYDANALKALRDAADAADLADHKRRVFVDTPIPPYDEGDMWVNATYPKTEDLKDGEEYRFFNDLARCLTPKTAEEEFSIEDWDLASKYTDDSMTLELGKDVQGALNAITSTNKSLDDIKNFADEAFRDNYVNASEANRLLSMVNNLKLSRLALEKQKDAVLNDPMFQRFVSLQEENLVIQSNLISAWEAYNTKVTEFITLIETIAENAKNANGMAISDKDRVAFNALYEEVASCQDALVRAIKQCEFAINQLLDSNISQLANELGGYNYLREALGETTYIQGGLVLTTLIALGKKSIVNGVNTFDVHSGISGIVTNDLHSGPAFWAGGDQVSIFDCNYDAENDRYYIGSTVVDPADAMIHHDGTAYFSKGNVRFLGKDEVFLGDWNNKTNYLHWKDGVLNIKGVIDLGSQTSESLTFTQILNNIREDILSKADSSTIDELVPNIDKALDDLQKSVSDTNNSIAKIRDFSDEAFRDNYLDASEANKLLSLISTLKLSRSDYESQVNEILNDELFKELIPEGSGGTGIDSTLRSAWDAYNTKVTEFITLIETIAENAKNANGMAISDKDRASFNALYEEVASCQDALVKLIKQCEFAINKYLDSNTSALSAELGGFKYLKEAITQHTYITGGLILSTLIALGKVSYVNDKLTFDVHSGISGIVTNDLHSGPAFWAGGDQVSIFDCNYDAENDRYYIGSTVVDPADAMIHHDGTAYFSKGNVRFLGKDEVFLGDWNNKTNYLHWKDGVLNIKGVIDLSSPTTYNGYTFSKLLTDINSTLQSQQAAIEEKLPSLIDKVNKDLQSQIDGAIETYFYEGEPTMLNSPWREWIVEGEDLSTHIGDLYYDKRTGFAYRFQPDSSVQEGYKWELLKDSEITKALAAAKDAQSTADGKMKVFYSQPTAPYQIGDLWVNAVFDGTDSDGNHVVYNNDLLRCKSKDSGSFKIDDWCLASKYNYDEPIRQLDSNVTSVFNSLAETRNLVDNIKEFSNEAFYDNYLSNTEKRILSEYRGQLIAAHNELLSRVTKVQEDVAAYSGNTAIDSVVKQNIESRVGTPENRTGSLITKYNTLIKALDDVLKISGDMSAFNSKKEAYSQALEAYNDEVKQLSSLLFSLEHALYSAYMTESEKKLEESIGSYKYLAEALGKNGSTILDKGLVMTQFLAMGMFRQNNNVQEFREWSGVSGIYIPNTSSSDVTTTEEHGGIAFWAGGMPYSVDLLKRQTDYEKFVYEPETWNGVTEYVYHLWDDQHTTIQRTLRPAKFLIYQDGTGYAAGGKIRFNEDGTITAESDSFYISVDKIDYQVGLTAAMFKYVLQDQSTNTVNWGNVLSAELRKPLNGIDLFAKSYTVDHPVGGGSIQTSTYYSAIRFWNSPTSYNAPDAAPQSSIFYDPDQHAIHVQANLVVTGGITMYSTTGEISSGIMDSIVVDSKTIGIVNGALTVLSVPGLSVSDLKALTITSGGSNLGTYSPTGSDVTINITPSKIGAADYVHNHSVSDITDLNTADFAPKSHVHSVKINGDLKVIAASGGEAVDLGTYLVSNDLVEYIDGLSFWGQSFNGSKAITGNLTDVGTITPKSGTDLKIVGNLVVTGGIVMYADDGATVESGFAALLAAHIDGKTIKYNSTEQKIYSVMSGIAVNGTTYKPNETTGIITLDDYPTSLDWSKIENKPSTFTPSDHTHTFASLTSKPTTLSGYGITDAYTKTQTYTQAEVNTKLTDGSVTKLGTATIGSSTKPIYWNEGKPNEVGTSLELDITGNSETATKLKNKVLLWGQKFDGSNNVLGSMSGVEDLTMSGVLSVNGVAIEKTPSGVLRIDGDLIVTGGITMYASDGVKSGMIDQVHAVLDQSLFYIKDGVITVTDKIGSGTVKGITINSTNYKPDANGTIMLPLNWDDLVGVPTTFTPSAHIHDDLYYTESEMDTMLGGKSDTSHTHSLKINGVTKTIEATGGTAVDLGTYLTVHQPIHALTINGTGTNTFTYTPNSSGASLTITPAWIGAPTTSGTGATGTWGISISGNAATATKLAATKTLWGQSFDGTANISGDMSSVGSITPTGDTLKIVGNLVVTGGITMYAMDGTFNSAFGQQLANYVDGTTIKFINDKLVAVNNGNVTSVIISGTEYTPTDGAITLPDLFAPSAHTHSIAEIIGLQDALNMKLDTSLKGAANGLATLDASGKVPSAQLPSYVDDVLEYTNKASFPTTGESGKIYIDQTTNLTYRWGGTAYTEISQSLALGETSSTAYAGDKGKQNATDIAVLKTGKADKATTLAGYGITDAYTKTQTYTKTEVNTKLTDGSVTKIGTADVGSVTKPIYLKAGVPTVVGTSLAVDITGNSATTTKLKTAVTLWGQSFDGSKAISGAITGASDITMSGALKLNGITIEKTSNGLLKINGDLIVTGGITMYASDGVSSGLMEQILVDGVTIGKNSDGALYAINTGNVRTIKMGTVEYTPNDSGVVELPAKVTWDNIDGKPSTFTPSSHTHTFASLTSKPTTLSGYGITDAKIVNGVITLGTATITPLTAHQTVTLASGTNNGTLKLTVNGSVTDNIAVKGLGSAAYTNSSAYATAGHTHNYAGSASAGGAAYSANKVNSRGNLTAYAEGSTTMGESGINLYTVYHNDYPVGYGNLIHINGQGAGQLLAEWTNSSALGHLYYRSKRDNTNNGWSAWGKVAFTTDNVASASKWATARKITLTGSVTGEVSIDGSGDVSLTTTTNHTHSYVPLSGGTMTGNLILKGGTSADMTYAGNVHPSIRFDNSDSSQNVSLIFTDYDSYRAPAGLKLVGSQGNEWFEAANIYATTFYGALSGNASTATTASKLGTLTVGSGTQHFYLSSGTATASTSTVGGTAKPMYLKAGVMTAISDTVGSTSLPVFLNAGTITACSTTLGVSITGNAATATTLQTARTLWGQSFNGSANISGDMSGVGQITFSTLSGTNGRALLYQQMADNDFFRIYCGGTGSNGGYVEIATADDGTEPIYVRQYSGTFTTLTRTLTLLDGNGNTTVPGTLTMANGKSNGTMIVSGNTSVGSLTVGGINVTKSSTGILKIDGNLVVTGGITMYATDGVASGLMEQILVDGTTIAKKADGTLYALNTGNVRSIIMGSTTYTPNDSGAITLPEKVTWANIEGKPSTFTPSSHTHAISQITNLQTTLDGKAAASHTHAYLPLSGGTVSGDLSVTGKVTFLSEGKLKIWNVNSTRYSDYGPEMVFVQTSIDNADPETTWPDKNRNDLFLQPKGGHVHIGPVETAQDSTCYIAGTLRVTGTVSAPTFSGNASSASYATSAGNADTVDGYHASAFALSGHTHSYLYTEQVSEEQNTDAYTWIREYVMSHDRGHVYNVAGMEWQYLYGISGGAYGSIIRSTYGNGVPAMQIMGLFNGSWSSWVNVLTEKNYNSYAPTLTGGGASGTWGINISGNADTVDGYHASAFTYNLFGGNIDCNETGTHSAVYRFDDSPKNAFPHSDYANMLIIGAGSDTMTQIGAPYNADELYFRRGTWYSTEGTIRTNPWKAILHSGNYSSYALPLTGGTVTGPVNFTYTYDSAIRIGTIRGTAYGSRTGEYIHMYDRVHIGYPSGWGGVDAPTYGLSTWGGAWFAMGQGDVGIGTTTPSAKLHVVGDIYTTTGFKKNGSSDSYVLLGGGGHKAVSDFATSGHTHNYLPLSGGTMTGTIHANDGAQNTGIKFKSNNANLNALSNQHLILGTAIRFGAYGTWDWNVWAGLKYDSSTKTIYLGLADGTIFGANAAQSGGTLKFPGVSGIYLNSGARISHGGSLYFGRSDNSGWLYFQDMASQNGTSYWMLTQAGYLTAKGVTLSEKLNSSVSSGSYLAANRGTAIINSTAAAGFNMLARMKSTNGVFIHGVYNDAYCFYYTADSVISADTNTASKQYFRLHENGYIYSNDLLPLGTNNIGSYGTRWSRGYFINNIHVGANSTDATAGGVNASMYGNGYIELSHSTPYIDFHYAQSTADYTTRIVATAADCLSISSHLYVGGAGASSYTLRVDGITFVKSLDCQGRFSVLDTSGNAAARITQAGDMVVSGGITMYSDVRKKDIISDKLLSVGSIADAPLFAFNYKSDGEKRLHTGTSAQYWHGAYGDMFGYKDEEGYYTLEYQNLGVAMGISLAREIIKYESKTDKKIRLMKKKINDLEAANKALDARIKELEGSREERRTA